MKIQSYIEKLWLQNKNLQEAVKVYLNRKHRITHPEGEFDKAGRWYPDASENLDTSTYRSPTRTRPYSYMQACRTLTHVVQNVFGITAPSALAAAKKLAKIAESELTTEYAKKVIDLEANLTDLVGKIDLTEIENVQLLRKMLVQELEFVKTATQRKFIEKEIEKLDEDIDAMSESEAA